MASTPSASALNAVLRCRGTIWTRNPPSKRPATSGCSLGLGGGAQRDSHAERARGNRASAKEAALQGGRVVVGRRLTVSCMSQRGGGNMLTQEGFRQRNTLVHPKLSQSTAHAHQSALVRQLARTLTPKLPGAETRSEVSHAVTCETRPGVRTVAFLQGNPRVITLGQLLSTVKGTCLSSAALVSDVVLLWRPRRSRGGATHLPHQGEQRSESHRVLQVNRPSPTDLTSSKGNSGIGQEVTEDGPD